MIYLPHSRTHTSFDSEILVICTNLLTIRILIPKRKEPGHNHKQKQTTVQCLGTTGDLLGSPGPGESSSLALPSTENRAHLTHSGWLSPPTSCCCPALGGHLQSWPFRKVFCCFVLFFATQTRTTWETLRHADGTLHTYFKNKQKNNKKETFNHEKPELGRIAPRCSAHGNLTSEPPGLSSFPPDPTSVRTSW